MNQMGNNCVVALTFQILIASMGSQDFRKNTPKKNTHRKIVSRKIDSHEFFLCVTSYIYFYFYGSFRQ